MVGQEPLSPDVRIFMAEEEALFYEWECGDSQQGSSSEGNLWAAVPSGTILSQIGAKPSGRVLEEVDFKETEAVYFEEAPGYVEAEVSQAKEGVEPNVESHPGEGMLLKNLRCTITNHEVKLWRYSYKIPSSVEIRVLKTHKRINWVVPGGIAVYKLMLKEGMRFPIPRLIRDVCDHYEITPSQLMPNAWRVIMSFESLSTQHGVECEIGEVLFSYYLKEHDTDKGRYKLIT